MLADRTVARLLTRAFGALVLLIVCSGLAGVGTVMMQHATVQQLSEQVMPLQLANRGLRAVLADAQRGLRGYLLTGDPAMLDAYQRARTDYVLAGQAMNDLATDGERAHVADQIARADAWLAVAERQRTAVPRSDEAARYVAEGWPLFETFLEANRALDADLAGRAAKLKERSAALGVGTTSALAGLTAAAALVAALTAVRTTRRITRPLRQVVRVLDGVREGQFELRADPERGPTEIRAVAAAVNAAAQDADRRRREERDIVRQRNAVRELGYRIRAHRAVDDAVQEAITGLAATLHADHVLLRMAPEQADGPPVASLRDEHADGALAELARCPVSWLRSGDVWSSDDPDPADGVEPPAAELAACAAAGAGPIATVTLSASADLLGALTLIRTAGSPAWTPVDVRLAETVAADLGRFMHLNRLYEREQQLVTQLRDLDAAKSDFMSTVSHELRTPLTSIVGYLEMLRDEDAGAINPAQERMLDVIARNTVRLRSLIEDLLILSKIEGGTFRTGRHSVDLAAVIEHAATAVKSDAAKAAVELRTEVSGPLPVHADADQLDRVLMNLLSNAVKFTPPDGSVTVTGRRQDAHVVLTVADTGMGIPPTEQGALFARFFRASNAVRHAIPGTGLGLAIVRTIVDNHRGSIQVQSTEGSGTTVTVSLPATG
ncbi:MAG TPA: ATP-binding protein [Actinoplanes sp.]|nr:ATP-binding protein [Actinoplanes sp.]